jgi:hypothetical protein
MKRLLLWAGLGLLLLSAAIVGYGVWFVRRAVVDPVQVRATAQGSESGPLHVEISVTGSEEGVVITEIDLARALREAWGLGPPAGFALAPLALEERENGDEAAAYVAKYNLETVRYVGKFPVRPGTPARLSFPAERPQAASGEIRLQHERGIGVGGAIGFVSVRIGPAPSP